MSFIQAGLNSWVAGHKDLLTLVIGSLAASITIATYRVNSNTKRADFIYKLHADFFGDANCPYREVRKALDADTHTLARFLQDEPENFIEYLNFFEMVAYLYKQGQLELSDVKALFGYYLASLNHPDCRKYLEARDFENLYALLSKLK